MNWLIISLLGVHLVSAIVGIILLFEDKSSSLEAFEIAFIYALLFAPFFTIFIAIVFTLDTLIDKRKKKTIKQALDQTTAQKEELFTETKE